MVEYMNFVLNIKPLEIRFSKIYGYGVSVLGIGLSNQDLALGFNFRKDIKIESDETVLYLFFYVFRTKIVLKTTNKPHCVCGYCGKPVMPMDDYWYCSNCNEEMYKHEIRHK